MVVIGGSNQSQFHRVVVLIVLICACYADTARADEHVKDVTAGDQPLLCDVDHWVYGGYCFQFEPTLSKPWRLAEEWCEARGAHLADVKDADTNAFLVAMVRKLYPDGAPTTGQLWLGLHDVSPGNIQLFQWTSTAPVTFTNWDINQPAHATNASKLCVALRGEDDLGRWRAADCSHSLPWVCQYELPAANQSVTSTTTRSPAITPTPTTLTCPDGWNYYEKTAFCYKHFWSYQVKDRLTWREAQSHCRAQGADIVSCHSEEEEGFVTQFLNIYKPPGFWIGLYKSDTFGYRWSDGSAVNYVNWAAQGLTVDPGDYCVEYNGRPEFGWSTVSCSLVRNWVCKVAAADSGISPQPETTAVPIVPSSTFDPTTECGTTIGFPWIYWQQFCYAFIDVDVFNYKGVSWLEAKEYCRSQYDADLVSIHSRDEQDMITSTVGKMLAFNTWIGLRRSQMNSPFTWQDGTVLSFEYWQRDHPSDNDLGLCASIQRNYGTWVVDNCGSTNAFICKRSSMHTTPTQAILASSTAVEQPNRKYYCPSSESFHLNGKCLHLVKEGQTWLEAQRACNSISGSNKASNLVTISDHLDQLATFSLLRSVDTNVWLGMYELERQFYWADNAVVTFVNWAELFAQGGSKSEKADVDKCVIMYDSDGRWSPNTCMVSLPYICQSEPVLTQSDIPQTSSCPNQFTQYTNGTCYHLLSSNTENEHLNWEMCRSKCSAVADFSTIVTIRDAYEQAFVQVFTRQRSMDVVSEPSDHVWLNLRYDKDAAAYQWVDTNWPLLYTNWSEVDGNSHHSKCAYLSLQSGSWHTAECGQTASCLCQTIEEKPPVIADPDQNLANCQISANTTGASDQWIDSGGRFCYTINYDMADQVSWFEARFRCNFIGSELLSLHSQSEVDFFSNLLQSFRYSFWIGMYKTSLGEYLWSDGSYVAFGNFPDNNTDHHPSSVPGCVAMDYLTGTWSLVPCGTALPYICAINKVPLLWSTDKTTFSPLTSSSESANITNVTEVSTVANQTLVADNRVAQDTLTNGEVAAAIVVPLLLIFIVPAIIMVLIMIKNGKLKSIMPSSRKRRNGSSVKSISSITTGRLSRTQSAVVFENAIYENENNTGEKDEAALPSQINESNVPPDAPVNLSMDRTIDNSDTNNKLSPAIGTGVKNEHEANGTLQQRSERYASDDSVSSVSLESTGEDMDDEYIASEFNSSSFNLCDQPNSNDSTT